MFIVLVIPPDARQTSIIPGTALFLACTCYDCGMGDLGKGFIIVDPEDRAIQPTIMVNGDAMDIVIPAGAQYRHPIRMVVRKAMRMKVDVGERARVILIEDLRISPLQPSFTSSPSPQPSPTALRLGSGQAAGEGDVAIHSMEVFLKSGADVEFISQQFADPSAHLTITQRSHVGDHATIRWKNITLGARQVEHDLLSEITGANAVSAIDWMFYAKGDEKYQLSARNVFSGRHGGGEITMKGVAEEKGHVRCNGKIEIGSGGGQTDTYLTQDILMLDKTSKVDAIPGLEIKTNDVKASHSATVSRVTDDDLFYFAARGIREREARRMFVHGFLGELVAKTESSSVREEILDAIREKNERKK